MMTAMIFIELTGSTVRDGGEGSDCRDCLSSNALCEGVIVQKKMRRQWWLRNRGTAVKMGRRRRKSWAKRSCDGCEVGFSQWRNIVEKRFQLWGRSSRRDVEIVG
ncbi:hypothetical protein L1887_06758 [Cichorium endivia]|nr:hypothetical protein L1887_06758 [Cichorium endivia]